MPRIGGLALKQSTINLKAEDNYQELWNFEVEVKNIFMTETIAHKKIKEFQLCLTG